MKELREERGYTQKQVADKLGLNSVTYLHYEKEQREPPLALLADMAQLYVLRPFVRYMCFFSLT